MNDDLKITIDRRPNEEKRIQDLSKGFYDGYYRNKDGKTLDPALFVVLNRPMSDGHGVWKNIFKFEGTYVSEMDAHGYKDYVFVPTQAKRMVVEFNHS